MSKLFLSDGGSSRDTNSFVRKLKFVVLGDASVGKTCILHSFLKGEFFDEYVPTIIENKLTQMKIGSSFVKLELWDTAGQEEYKEMRRLSYHQTDLFIIVLSVVDRNSLTNALEKWYPDLMTDSKDTNMIFVGNKIDLRTEEEIENGNHLSKQSIEEMMGKIKCCYYECSAKLKEGVEEIFREGAKLCLGKMKDEDVGDEFNGKNTGAIFGCCTSGGSCKIF